MAYAKLSSNQPISAGLHRAYLRDRKHFVKPAYALPFNEDEYQQAQGQFDYIQSIKAIVFKAKDVLIDIWQRSAHW